MTHNMFGSKSMMALKRINAETVSKDDKPKLESI